MAEKNTGGPSSVRKLPRVSTPVLDITNDLKNLICMRNSIQLLKRKNIGINIEINFTFVNLGLLLLFLCHLGSIHGRFTRFYGTLQGRWLRAVSTHKSLPHRWTAHWLAIEAPNSLRQRSKADFTVGNILSFNQYFGRHGLPSSGSYIILVKR